MPTAPKTFRLPQANQPKPQGQRSAEAYERGREYRTQRWLDTRMRIMVRDGMQCQQCHKIIMGKREAHIDHIVPKVLGGTSDDENLQTLCHSCHSVKTKKERAN